MTAASNSEARKRLIEAQQRAECPLSQPNSPEAGPNEAVRSVLVEAFAREMYERVMEATADQWRRWPFLTDTAKEAYRVEAAEVMTDALGPAFAAILREHTDRALAEVEQRIEHGPHRLGHNVSVVCSCVRCEATHACLDIVRAARQEQGR